MTTNEEHEVAQGKLDAAVEQFLADVGWKRNMVTTGWVMVLHQTGFDSGGEYEEAYPIIYMGGSLSDHAGIGLMMKGLDILRGVDPYHVRQGESDAND